MFWLHNLLGIKLNSRGDTGSDSSMHSGITHERYPNFEHRKKTQKTERGEFITPPRPTGRRSNKMPSQASTLA